jgi:hypothetical protein
MELKVLNVQTLKKGMSERGILAVPGMSDMPDMLKLQSMKFTSSKCRVSAANLIQRQQIFD